MAVWFETLRQTINQMMQGGGNQTGSVTLTANAATTTVTDHAFAAAMVPVFTPTTANASAEVGAGTMYVSSRTNGSFVVTHANNAQTDRTFLYQRGG